jgi:hypothetical protein
MKPNTTGERIAANADPVFMIPLAEPEYRGAISIGIAHIGPIVISAKKNAPARAIASVVRSLVKKSGIIQTNEQRKQITTRLRRACLRSLVFRKTESVKTPPSPSPITPAKFVFGSNRGCCLHLFWGIDLNRITPASAGDAGAIAVQLI